jgi:hypothetical protein
MLTHMSIYVKCSGPAYRNRTHIHGVEDRCIIHYTKAGYWLSQHADHAVGNVLTGHYIKMMTVSS